MIENLGLDPLPERRKRGAGLQKETLTPKDAPVIARYKARLPFTMLDARQRIMQEAKDKPAAKRERSMRRRLTPFDRALSEEQAEVIDRLIRAHLAIMGKLRGASWQESVDGSKEPGLPVSDRECDLLGIFAEVKKRLPLHMRRILADLCLRMTPDFEPPFPVNHDWIAAAVRMADIAVSIQKYALGKNT